MGKMIESVITALNGNKKVLETMLGVKLDYQPQSILQIEKRLAAMYPFGRKVKPEAIVMVGVYLGETIRRNIQGADVVWGEDENYIFDTPLIITNVRAMEPDTHFKIKPILRVEKYVNRDRTDTLWAFYSLCIDMCGGKVNLTEKADEKWNQTRNGYKFRMTKEEKDKM